MIFVPIQVLCCGIQVNRSWKQELWKKIPVPLTVYRSDVLLNTLQSLESSGDNQIKYYYDMGSGFDYCSKIEYYNERAIG